MSPDCDINNTDLHNTIKGQTRCPSRLGLVIGGLLGDESVHEGELERRMPFFVHIYFLVTHEHRLKAMFLNFLHTFPCFLLDLPAPQD